MEIRILDKNFVEVAIVEKYESFIWTERYNQYGDFELYSPMGEAWLDKATIGNYISTTVSDRLMMIESIEITTNHESGNYIKVSGRSIEALLARRIVWTQTIIASNVQNLIKTLINDAIINPSLAERKIDNFVFEETDDTRITSINVEAQYTGDNIYEVVSDVCQQIGCGFKVILKDKKFIFKLYKGKDMSGTVTFSNDYGNLLESEYRNDYTEYYNVTLVAGEGEGTSRKTSVVGDATGVDRIELYTDARDLSSNGTTLANYLNQLKQRGNEKLAEFKTTEGFQGTVVPDVIYTYGVDYSIGDYVKFQDIYGHYGKMLINEYIISCDEQNGYYCYPTFVVEG